MEPQFLDNPYLKGGAITLAILVGVELISRLVVPISSPTPIYMVAVGLCSFVGGYPAGILSGFLTFGYAVYSFSRSGQFPRLDGDSSEGTILLALGMAGVVFLVSALKHRSDNRQQEIGQLREGLEARSRELAKQQKRKDLLLYLLLHKLRHSVTTLSGYVEFACSRAKAIKDAQLVNDTTKAAEVFDELSMLIWNLVELMRLEERKVVLKLEDLDLSGLVEEKIRLLAGLIESKGVEMKWNQPLWLPLVKCDREMIGRVMENLLRNAVEHTPERGVIQVAVATAFGPGIEVMVKNSGRGIPAVEQTKLFQGFDELRTEDLAKRRGGGIGLVLCRMAVEAHGGTIGVQSRPGESATFTFRLPMKTS
jgi:signal transduction histidine kinase